MKNILKYHRVYKKYHFFSSFSILVGMLLGPIDLVESSEDMMRVISSLSVGLKKNNFEMRIFNIYFSLTGNG